MWDLQGVRVSSSRWSVDGNAMECIQVDDGLSKGLYCAGISVRTGSVVVPDIPQW